MKRLEKSFFIVVFIFCLFVKIDVYAAEYDYDSTKVDYKMGDVVKYNGIKFYVIEDSLEDQDYVTLLKAFPLSVDEVNKYGVDSSGVSHINRYTYQNGEVKNNNGYGGVAYYSSEACGKNGSSGCTTDYNKSEIKYIVDDWANYNIDKNDLKEDHLGYKTRLITIEELTNNFGYFKEQGPSYVYYKSDENTPFWVYSENYKYWTMSVYEDSKTEVWSVKTNGELFFNSVAPGFEHDVVRPVINLKKGGSEIENKTENNTSNLPKIIANKSYKIGDEITYNGIKFYVIKNSSESDSKVTVIKAEPLTVDEVNKYGKDHINMYESSSKYYKQAYNFNGYGYISFYSAENCRLEKLGSFISNGCTSDYTESDIKYVVDNWSNDNIEKSNLATDSLGYKVRLITLDELMNDLGYLHNGETITHRGTYSASENTPKWVYNSYYSYLTMTPADDSPNNIVAVSSNGTLNIAAYVAATMGYTEYKGGVRPVVTFQKENAKVDNFDKVSVPDTFLNTPVIGIVIGIILIVTGIIIGYIIIRKRKNKLN